MARSGAWSSAQLLLLCARLLQVPWTWYRVTPMHGVGERELGVTGWGERVDQEQREKMGG